MASATHQDPTPADASSAPQDITNLNRPETDPVPSSTPVEMTSLSSKPNPVPGSTSIPSSTESPVSLPTASQPSNKNFRPASSPVTNTTPMDRSLISKSTSKAEANILGRTFSTAIGPSSDQPIPLPKDSETAGPTLMITLLLTSGARHPFKLDSKYLNKRNVEVTGNDPFNLSVYKLKELILREWREEWEAKPSSPTSIRLISFGKLLDDKAPLKDSRFNYDTPNVVHMTLKPQDYVEDEDAKGGKSGLGQDRDANDRSPGCRCVIL